MFTEQDHAPIVEALAAYEKESHVSFGVPGHKSGKGAPSDVRSLLGKQLFKGDATTQKGIDDRRQSKRVRQNAERLAAHAWGAEHCFFSTNGGSLSNHVALSAVAGPGEKVLVARNSHKSLIGALIIGHVRPVFLEPEYDPNWDIEHGITAAEVERKLDAHPDARGVFIVCPTYYGVASDLRKLADVCHRRDKPLVVDEAWGPHFPFHPEMPPSAIHSGADLSVCSIHKTMAGLEQASIMLLKSRLVPADRFSLCFDLFETTSPSVPILATIDATRRQFVQDGRRLIGEVLAYARRAREQLAAIGGVRVMGKEVLNGDGRCALEEMKILLDISSLGVSGYEADDWLTKEYKLSFGLSDRNHLLAVFTVGNNRTSASRLVAGVTALAKEAGRIARRKGRPPEMPRLNELKTEMVMTPSEAFFARAEHVPLEKAVGRVAAEMVSPYPPGIPAVLPGQRVGEAHVAYLSAGWRAGFFVMDASDMTVETLRVVA
jgi:arginine decarboxylase